MALVETKLGNVSEESLSKWQLVIDYMSPIIDYYTDPETTEIMINRYDCIFVESYKGMRKVDATFKSEEALQRLIRQLSIVLRQDSENPDVMDARFPDQSRANCTLPSATPSGSTMTIRIAPRVKLTFDDLVGFGSLTQEMKACIEAEVKQGSNIIISGGTGSGKTTLLRALSEFIPDDCRVITCEDTQELYLDLPNSLSMEAPERQSSTLRLPDLIKTTLRQRPDRVFVGEIRDSEACDAFLQIINTGHEGCATSVHANSPELAVRRMSYLISKDGLMSRDMAKSEILYSVNLIIQTKKTKRGKRVTHIARIDNINECINLLYRYDVRKNEHIRISE